MHDFEPGEIVNLARYPIANPEDAQFSALVTRLKNELDTQQYCVLPEFITKRALASALAEVNAIKSSAYRNTSHRNCYLYRKGDDTLEPNHPKNVMLTASYSMIGNHLIPEKSLLKTLYFWPSMMHFVAEIVGVKELFPNVDQYQPVNVNCFSEGDQSAWHFDSWNAFTMTLMLQSAESGGEFEIVPNTRTDDDQHFADVAKILAGDRSRVVVVPREPQALVIFRGCNSMHRVTPVEGQRQRLMSIFVYEEQPGIGGDAKVNETVYGIPIAEQAEIAR